MAGDLAALREIADFGHLVGVQINGVDLGFVFAGVADVFFAVGGEAAVAVIGHAGDFAGFDVGAVAAAVGFSLQLLLHEEEIAVVGGKVFAGEIQLGVALRAFGIAAHPVAGDGIKVFDHGGILPVIY